MAQDSVELSTLGKEDSLKPNADWVDAARRFHAGACIYHSSWDVLMLGQLTFPDKEDGGGREDSMTGMFSYIIRRSGCQKMISKYETKPVPLDRLVWVMQTDGNLQLCRSKDTPLARLTSGDVPHMYAERNLAAMEEKGILDKSEQYVPLSRHILNRLYDEIVLVNMKKRDVRRSLAHFTLRRQGIKYTLFPALDGTAGWAATLYNSYLNRTKHETKRYINSAGAMGILLTVREILNTAWRSAYHRLLVLEDDIIFHKDFYSRLILLLETNPKLWEAFDVIHLGSNQLAWHEEMDQAMEAQKALFYEEIDYSHNPRYPFHDCAYGMFAISFNQKAIQYLYSKLRTAEDVALAVDLEVCAAIFSRYLRGASLYPQLFIADVSVSDNMGSRNMVEFSKTRRWDLPKYNGLLWGDLSMLFTVIRKSKVSIRHMIQKYASPASRIWEVLVEVISIYDEKGDVEGLVSRLTSFLAHADISGQQASQTPDPLLLASLIEGDWTPFVVVITGHNTVEYLTTALDSIFNQQYPAFAYRVVFVNDGSTDGTEQHLHAYIAKRGLLVRNRLLAISTREKRGPAYARYLAYKSIQDNEVAVMVDGDDRLAHNDVFTKLHELYSHGETETTYGQFYYDEGQGSISKMAKSGRHSFPSEVTRLR